MSTIPKQMQTTLDHIVETALARPSLSEVSKDELLILTQEFPYAPVLQFLYTKKLQESGDPRFGNSVTRTALFFNNPHWLHQQLRATSQEESIKRAEQALSGVEETIMPAPLTHLEASETIENEQTTSPTLSNTEAALVAAITESPNETLLQSREDAIHLETLENESFETTDVLQIDVNVNGDEQVSGIDDFEPEEDISAPEYVSSDDDPLEEDALVAEMPAETPAETSASDTIMTTSETPETISDDSIESQIDLRITEETPVDETSAEDIEAPSPEIYLGEDTGDETELDTNYDAVTLDIPPTEAPDDIRSSSDSGRVDTISGDEDLESDPEPTPISLITVIAPVLTSDFNPIHTIKLAEETDNDDDDDMATSVIPVAISNEASDSQTITGSTDADVMRVETEQETDNDDDAVLVALSDQDSQDDSLSGDGLMEETETSHPTGLENMGFLPEELLEDAGVDPLSGLSEKEPVQEASEWLDDDHPDATDPREMDDSEDHLSDFEPGDLIKMAGLDQHYETELSFEPLHLTDYFASVGVSLPPEEQADVIGRPAKSFTGWIRSMKRIHPEKTVVHFNPSESDQIRAEAEMSNEQEEVLTETMAGIYALQGLTNKAIDIYEKLSLLNPEKSAIFAAKISELKGRSS